MVDNVRGKLLGILLGLSGLSCAGSLAPPSFEPFRLAEMPGASRYPDAPAVVVLDRGELSFRVDPKLGNPLARLRRLRRIAILRPTGVERFRRVAVVLKPTTRINGFRLRATWPDGHVETQGDPVRKVSEDGLSTRVLAVDDVVPGTVIEAIYDIWFGDLRFLPHWTFEADIPTQRSEYAVVVPEGFRVDLRFSREGRFVDRPPERFETASGVRFSWSLGDLPARFAEDEMPRPQLLSPRAHVVYQGYQSLPGLRSWDDVGTWVLGRQPQWPELSEATEKEALRVAGEVGEEEKALRLLEVVARDLEAEQIPPLPLWRAPFPHPEGVLLARRANPTSRGLLLVALLRAVGLPALPVLYARRTEDVLLPDFPSLTSLDGIAAAIPRERGVLYLNPAETTVSGRVPPPELQGQRVVILRKNLAEVARVPTSRPEDSQTDVTMTLRLDPRGDVFGTLEARLTGAEAGVLRARLLRASPDDFAEIVRAFLASRGAGLGPTSVNIADLRVLRRPLLITGNIDARSLVKGEGEELFSPLNLLLGGIGSTPKEVRRAPRDFGHPRATKIRVTLSLPENWQTVFSPPVEVVKGPGVEVELGGRVETERRLGFQFEERLSELTIPADSHAAWRRHRLDRLALAARTFGVKRPPERVLDY